MIMAPGGKAISQAPCIQVIDDQGQEVTLPNPARRIIALYGAYNEILAAMGLEDRLTGRTKADFLPSSIMTKPSIGTHMRPNIELIMGLKPDLVVQSAGRREAMLIVEQLRKEGLNVVVFHPSNFEELFSVVKRLGILTNEKSGANKLINSMQSRLQKIEHKLGEITIRPKVFFEVRYPNLLAAGRGSIVNDIIKMAGGVNCIESHKNLVRIGMEALIKRDPDVYIIQRGPMNKKPSHPSKRPYFYVLRAVLNKKMMMVDEQIFSRPGPRSVKAVEQLAAFLYPEKGF